MKKFMRAAMALAVTLGIGGTAIAQPPRHLEPGSVLIYPLFDSRPASATVVNLTNTSEDRQACGNGFRQGDVRAHYVYYGQDASGGVCLEFDRFEDLSPADTISVLASRHNPEGETGFLVVSATDPEQGGLIDFDFLIGSAYVANADIDVMWSYTPYPFLALANAGATNCSNNNFVLGAGIEGPIRFDGAEYTQFPDKLYLDSFFEEEDGVFDNVLTLMSTSGQDYINEIDVFTFNNKEDKFSRTFKFVCHTSVELSEITSVARSLGGDPDEFIVETGWMEFDGRAVLDLSGNPVTSGSFGNGPAILGVFVQVVRDQFTAGHGLHYSGSQTTQLPN